MEKNSQRFYENEPQSVPVEEDILEIINIAEGATGLAIGFLKSHFLVINSIDREKCKEPCGKNISSCDCFSKKFLAIFLKNNPNFLDNDTSGNNERFLNLLFSFNYNDFDKHMDELDKLFTKISGDELRGLLYFLLDDRRYGIITFDKKQVGCDVVRNMLYKIIGKLELINLD